MMKISELSAKDIVNMENGKRLGHLNDLDINLETGRIEAIIISNQGKMMTFLGNRDAGETVIPWKNIVKIGSDVILVELPERYKQSVPSAEHAMERKDPYS
ncbi:MULTISPECIES: YlmC/YmxH family sporulation protein [Shouchella]|uniref:Sporulation protein n=3 Tax=Bacillaceae TaxID=186817 RepID=A0A060LUK0_9BACI|nr:MULTISPECIES: YlmC/YmxH family sporulation protein [Bacillaceae]RQW20748.1 YlmC/YmxH family sporulation protein [Bacillus sp. C1-1]AIC94911.1 sporulation protein [Shouchella lehensis G1]KQL58163.1 sporulation protein [Alkalicoccobacillus plakortidis]MBG9784239.1 sporulation protein [Shouchella lehensis]TES50771.1 YlmC/YmxH family sporulation protein [Shouchella lehensis]